MNSHSGMKSQPGWVGILAVGAMLATGTSIADTRAPLHKVTGTVFVIVMENTDWKDIKGSRNAPYLNSLLKHPQASYAKAYFNPPYLHPSEPNYIWMEAGDNFGIRNDADATFKPNQIHNQPHLSQQLDQLHVSWKTYQEDIDGQTCPLSTQRPYYPKHNPFVYFDDVTDGFDPHSKTCIEHVRPFSELAGDLMHNKVPRYAYITPNICNDMHDNCAPLHNRIRQGDDWLKKNLPTILKSRAYRNNGAIFVTWDEGGTGDGPIGMILLSPLAKGHGYANDIRYTHGSLLRTLEEIYGAPLLRDANKQTSLVDLFK